MALFRRILAGFWAVIITVMLSGGGLYAQDAPSNNPGSGLNITPTRNELRIERGKVDVVTLTLKNVSGGDIVAKVFINDFESDNETGEPKLITDPNRELATSIRRFLVGVTDIELKKDETKTFDIPVQIPQDASPGAYYGVVRYVAVPKGSDAEGPGQVSLTASVGSLVLVEVPGDIKEQIQLRGVNVYRDQTKGTLFTKTPNAIGVEVRNTGNTFSKPFGTVTVKNMFGKKIHEYDLNNGIPKSNVLPNSTRIFRDELKNVSGFGRFTIETSVSYANGGDVLTAQKTFWVVPLWLIVLLVIFVLALLFGGKLLYDKSFKRKR